MKTEKSSVRIADLNEGSDLELRTLDGICYCNSHCGYRRTQPDNSLLVKSTILTLIAEGSLTDFNG